MNDYGEPEWCELPEATPDQLVRVAEYHHDLGLLMLALYEQAPNPERAAQVAFHIVESDVANQLLLWFKERGVSLAEYNRRKSKK